MVKNYFEDDGTQNYLVFQEMCKYFKKIAFNGRISTWKLKGLSDESIKTPSAPDDILNPLLAYVGAKAIVKFNGSCLKQDKITYTHGAIVNIYIVYKISKNFNISSYPTLENCLFGAVTLTKHVDVDKDKYSGYGIGFDRRGKFSLGNGFDRNCIIFGVDMSSSVHVHNKKNNILIFIGSTILKTVLKK